ncbi:hypothetical protein QYE76_005393 [Lolium multiflorum]|uniref:Uncharacterized protein n=1 Tax=Lolium multiflorum TaxID=4521 RepID=A0AAD8RSM0_LOLMU|nr:hypothetical protein QYE76_005393 [Lolium multiflorum]
MLLDADYFNDDVTHSPKEFRRRFRMNKDLFLKIVHGVEEYDTYFMAKKDCTGLWGFTSIHKCTAAMRCLAYGAPPDTTNDYLRMAESICTETLYRFYRAVIAVFAKDYLRAPRADDTAQILQKNAARGFPGILGSIDYMHWGWKNRPFVWQGIYKGHTGTNNGINVLQRSPVFARLAEGQAPAVNFEVNGDAYNKGYYLADGIYPTYATFEKTILSPSNENEAYFATCLKVVCKDVERVFGVLQQRFAIVSEAPPDFSTATTTPSCVGFKRSYYFRFLLEWEVDVVFINNRTCDRVRRCCPFVAPVVIKIFYALLQAANMASPINFNQFLEKEKLKSNGSNFTDWFRHVRIFLNGGNLQYVLDAPLGDPPAN